MNLRYLFLPAALIAALVFADTPDAEAHPFGHGARTGLAYGPPVVVGGRVSVPIGRRHARHAHRGHYRRVVSYVGGHYETRTRQVEVPGRQIGFDFKGRPLYAGSRTVAETYQVWIPRRRVVQRVWVPHRRHGHARGFVTVGGRVRIH